MSASSSTTSSEAPFAAASDGVRVAVRLTPRGRSDRIDGVARLADGTAVLKVAVCAPPAEGRANDALLRLLATAWHLPRRDLAIVGGQRSRSKIVRIAGDPAALIERLTAAVSTLPRPS